MSFTVHLQAFLKDPKGVAALVPSSQASVDRIVSKVRTEEARLIVEFGPGNGVLTRAVLERLGPGARLVAIEANGDLAARLTAQFEDPRLTVVHDTAVRVQEILSAAGLRDADAFLSGIPFTFLDQGEARAIVAGTHASLAAGGSFVTYQMFYQPRRHLRAHLERCFDTVRSEFELRNLPPLRICQAVKARPKRPPAAHPRQ